MTSWFISKNGVLFTRTLVGIAAAGAFSSQIALHGPLLGKYQEFMQMYRDGLPRRLPSDVLQTADLVLTECGLEEDKKKKFRFFTVIGRNLFHAGGVNFPWGAIIGLPFMFEIKTKNDAKMLGMKIHGKDSIDWDIEGKPLLESLILSENAKKFAIARETYACDIRNVFLNAALYAFAILFPARVVQKANQRRKSFNYPLKTRAMFYAIVYAMGFLICHCLKEPNDYKVAKNCDREAAYLGPKYLEGGIEFYEKMLNKNKALRKLMGSDGERLYDLTGNESYILFAPLLPISKRLQYLQELKEELKETDFYDDAES